jgi:membrane protein implicated in regulation of membrane protease activity
VNSFGVTLYITALLVIGLAMAIVGTLLALGGGTAVALIGAAAIGAGLVLIGVRMMRPTER